MELKTNRLILRPISADDRDTVHELHSFPETDRYNTLGMPSSPEETKTLVLNWMADIPAKKQVFVIESTEHHFVGIVGINIGKIKYRNAEIWYKLHPTQWNKGYATETVKLILDFCFTVLNLHRVEAGCATANIASKKVLKKNGFLQEALLRKLLPIRGEWHDAFAFAILDEDR